MNYFARLKALWKAGLTNQGHVVATLPRGSSRQQSRRQSFIRRNKELVAQFGYNTPCKVRRRIAWDSLSESPNL